MSSPLPPSERELLTSWIGKLRANLWGSVLPFWAAHSVDAANGGFFNCLDSDGAVFDTTKHVWLQGRQVWMFAKLATTFSESEFAAFVAAHPSTIAPGATGGPAAAIPLSRAALVAAAVRGAEFLRTHAIDPATGHLAFALTCEGAPSLAQRKPFSAAFAVLAFAEVARATGDVAWRAEALTLLDRIIAWDAAPGGWGAALGKPSLPGARALAPLNFPMILLSLVLELSEHMPREEAQAFYASTREDCVARMLRHVDASRGHLMFECVDAATGKPDLGSPEGRLLNPGHAIEAGWFMLDAAARVGNAALRATALRVIDAAYLCGWDGALVRGGSDVGTPAAEAAAAVAAGSAAGQGAGAGSGGFIYFRDALGFSPTALEAHMKLWWPSAEAMVAFAKAYAATGDAGALARFDAVAEWVWTHLVDERFGEWWGYADRTGAVTHRFKGGPYKGCFHVPRALLYAERALTAALERAEAQ